MYSWLGLKVTSLLQGYVFNVVSQLMTGLTVLVAAAFTLWMMLYGWAVLRNEVPETVPTFMWKTVKITFVILFALQASLYITNVWDIATDFSSGVAATFVPAGAPPAASASPYALLDHFCDRANQQVADIMTEAGIMRTDLLLAAVIFSFGSVLFQTVAVFVVTLATVLLAFVIAVGPIFILCLAWRPTQRFFDSWLSMVLNAVVVSWFAFFALGLSTYIGDQIFNAIQLAGGFLGPTLNVLAESIKYCVMMLVMAIICFQAPSLAAGLTGGAAMQQGIQMLQSAMIASGVRSANSFARPGESAGGAVQRGTGLSYQAGRATARAATASARAAGTVATGAGHLAKEGYRIAKTAAYKAAALRGRGY